MVSERLRQTVTARPVASFFVLAYAFSWVAWLLEQGPTVALRVLNVVGFASLLTWVYNRTESVLLALLTHAGINTANSTLVAILLVVHTRARLGYDETGPSTPR